MQGFSAELQYPIQKNIVNTICGIHPGQKAEANKRLKNGNQHKKKADMTKPNTMVAYRSRAFASFILLRFTLCKSIVPLQSLRVTV